MKLSAKTSSPEFVLMGILLVWNGAVALLTEAGLWFPELAVALIGVVDGVAVVGFSLRVLLASPNRFTFWHFYAALAAASFGAYGVSGAPELSDGAWIAQVLFAFAFVKIGLASMWLGVVMAAGHGISLRQTVSQLGAWLSGQGIRVAWILVGARWAFQFVAFSQGIVISGTAGHMGELGPISAMLVMVLPLAQVASLISCVVLVANARAGERRIWIALLALEFFGAALFSGRRVMLGLACIALVLWRLSDRKRTISLRTAVVGTGLISVVVGVAWPFFFYMRGYAINEEMLGQEAYGNRLGVFLADVLPGALNTFSLSDSYLGDSAYAENLSARITLTSYFAQIIEASNEIQPMLGEVMLASVEANVPHAIWWTKPEIDVEDMVNAHFGLPRVDSPSTYAAQAYSDFGLMGVFFYFMVFGALLSLALNYLPNCKFLATRVFILALLFGIVCEVESEVVSVLSSARWWLIAVLLDAILAGMSAKPPLIQLGQRPLTTKTVGPSDTR
jgi:hypothetical protein